MADLFKLTGTLDISPQVGFPTGLFSCIAALEETVTLKAKETPELTLAVDSPVSIGFGGVTNAHVVYIKTVGGKVRVRLTSADGALQSIPVDSFLQIISLSVPYTAIDLTRVPGVSTKVEIFLGEKA